MSERVIASFLNDNLLFFFCVLIEQEENVAQHFNGSPFGSPDPCPKE